MNCIERRWTPSPSKSLYVGDSEWAITISNVVWNSEFLSTVYSDPADTDPNQSASFGVYYAPNPRRIVLYAHRMRKAGTSIVSVATGVAYIRIESDVKLVSYPFTICSRKYQGDPPTPTTVLTCDIYVRRFDAAATKPVTARVVKGNHKPFAGLSSCDSESKLIDASVGGGGTTGWNYFAGDSGASVSDSTPIHVFDSLGGIVRIGDIVRAATRIDPDISKPPSRFFRLALSLSLADRGVTEDEFAREPLSYPGVLGHVLTILPWCMGYTLDMAGYDIWYTPLACPTIESASGDCEDMTMCIMTLYRMLQYCSDRDKDPGIQALARLVRRYVPHVATAVVNIAPSELYGETKKRGMIRGEHDEDRGRLFNHVFVMLVDKQKQLPVLYVDGTSGTDCDPRQWPSSASICESAMNDMRRSVSDKATAQLISYPTRFDDNEQLLVALHDMKGRTFMVVDDRKSLIGIPITIADGATNLSDHMRLGDPVPTCECRDHPEQTDPLTAAFAHMDMEDSPFSSSSSSFQMRGNEDFVLYARQDDYAALRMEESFTSSSSSSSSCTFSAVASVSFVVAGNLRIKRALFRCTKHSK